MPDLTLISCSKNKKTKPSRAEDLYTSALFRKSLLHAVSIGNPYFIVSAKHGLLEPHTVIEPYDVTLNNMSRSQQDAWGERVVDSLKPKLKPGDSVLLLTGNTYRRPIERRLQKLGVNIRAPLSGSSLGRRLSILSRQNSEAGLAKLYSRFYAAIDKLIKVQGGGVRLSDATGRMTWPARGVYFLLEDSECRSKKNLRPRITRVGTHAVSTGSKTTLWDRVSTHKGLLNGSGSHRSSIFRLHVGRALMAKGLHQAVETWGVGQSASKIVRDTEQSLEQLVSSVIGNMRLVWLNVADEASAASDRSYIEKNSIGLLSRMQVLAPAKSEQWLGNWSVSPRITTSGLWNLNYLFDKPDPRFIKVVERYTESTLGHAKESIISIAPAGWHGAKKKRDDAQQLALFADDPL